MSSCKPFAQQRVWWPTFLMSCVSNPGLSDASYLMSCRHLFSSWLASSLLAKSSHQVVSCRLLVCEELLVFLSTITKLGVNKVNLQSILIAVFDFFFYFSPCCKLIFYYMLVFNSFDANQNELLWPVGNLRRRKWPRLHK